MVPGAVPVAAVPVAVAVGSVKFVVVSTAVLVVGALAIG
jgi:hypothetical protein